jgi:2-aminoethylphosphonate aminotransferase
MRVIKRNILLNPGPATTTETVKRSLLVPDICPREKEFARLMQEVRSDLVNVVNGGTQYTCVLFGGSGTAGMEACIASVPQPGKKIAIVNNGAYGERMIKIAQTYQIDYVEIPSEVNRAVDVTKIENVFKKEPNVTSLAMVHHETTTGLLNPLSEVSHLCKKHHRIFIVDAISSYAGIPIDIQKNNVDFLISTSNKCIQGMAGVSFVICNKTALEYLRPNPRRSFYLSLIDQYDCFEKTGEMRFTPPVQVVYALKQALKEYFNEGGVNRYQRYTANWKTLREGLSAMGFKFLLDPVQESHILLTIMEPSHPQFNFIRLHDALYKKGFTIYPGKIGPQKTFRLSSMGDITPKDIKNFLKALKEVLKTMKVNLSV